MIKTGNGQFINYTPYEIYLSFRTAPIGALGVAGALYESTLVMSQTLLPAYGTGYAIGTFVVKPLLEAYAPSLYALIGSSIGYVVDTLSSALGLGAAYLGEAQAYAASFFELGSLSDTIQSTGGDYLCAKEWQGNSSAGCGVKDICVPNAAY